MWKGHYYSGRDASKLNASVTVTPAGLDLWLDDHRSLHWPYHAIRQAQGAGAGEPVRFEHGGSDVEPPESLVVIDPSILKAIRTAAPVAEHIREQRSPAMAMKLGLIAAGILGVLTGAVAIGLPFLAEAAASRIPVDWERKLGQNVFDTLAPPAKRCGGPALEAVEQLVDKLAPSERYAFTVAIVRDPQVNAFAAPGGFVVVFSGLLDKTERPEELAGVLAHEIEHVTQRHSMRALARDLSIRAALALLLGDLSEVAAMAAQFGSLSFQRADEESADRFGMERMVDARIDPEGMVDAFRMLKESSADMPKVAKYFSTHPQMEDRIGELARRATAYKGPWEPALPDGDWKKIAAGCDAYVDAK